MRAQVSWEAVCIQRDGVRRKECVDMNIVDGEKARRSGTKVHIAQITPIGMRSERQRAYAMQVAHFFSDREMLESMADFLQKIELAKISTRPETEKYPRGHALAGKVRKITVHISLSGRQFWKSLANLLQQPTLQ